MELTLEQTYALNVYRAANGRNWKSKLNLEWEQGVASGALQEIRNQLGPNWLAGYQPDRVRISTDMSLGGWR